MKEGLRSGNSLAKPATDKVLPGRGKNGNDDIKQTCLGLNDDVAQRTDSSNEECVEDGLDGNERKRSRLDGLGNEGDSVVKKRVKEDVKMQNVGRVLRSRTRTESRVERDCIKVEFDDQKTIRESDDECEKERVVDMGMEKSEELQVGKVGKKVKGKRGRPPKALESYESSGEERKKLKVKRGRPPKMEKTDGPCSDGRNKVKKKRGRPISKMQEGDVSDYDRGKKLKGKRGRPPKDKGTYGVLKTKFNNGKKIHGLRRSGRVKFEKWSEKKSMKTNQENSVKSTRTEKKVVRDRIIELLLGAGWKIEYRPRHGREYKDAVYVSPEQRTYWSVTLAYRVLKNHYEKEGDNSNTRKTGFTFTPIPEDELSILNREVHKVRCDKNKKRLKKDTDGEPVIGKKKNKWKLHKGKPNSASSAGKPLKRGNKGKPSQGKQDNLVARNRKQQETQNRKRCGLLVRKSVEGAECDSDGYVPYDGKRTVLAWMIDLGTLPLNGKVEYCKRRKTRVMHKGTVTRDGICCDCCGEVFSISKFEAHAGAGTNTCYPFQSLYLESGASLLECIQESWNKQDESERKGFHLVDVDGEDPNDDTCGICGDGGDLICCDGCPSTFHQSCLDIERFPSGKWNCVYCTCKFCGIIDENTCQMVDDDDSAMSKLLICSLCEEKYHQSCIRPEDAIDDDPDNLSFCGKKCQQIFQRLQMLLGVKHELDEGYTWTLICRADAGSNLYLDHVHQKVECNAKLAVALLVMDECFLPMPDHRSGINLIHNIVYNFGSNFNRLNYSGFFMAILEKDDEIISAASIRIHGNELAEMPFIGTRYMYRRQGMCRRLLSGIESALCSLNVEKLVIPAVTELKETWTSIFGFKPVEASSKQKMRNMNLLVFPGVDMLQKPVLKYQTVENMISSEGLKSSEVEHQTMVEVADSCDKRCPNGFDLNICTLHDESAAVESSLQLPVGSSHNTSDVTSETLNFSESIADTKCMNQFCVTHDNAQGNDKMSSASHADEKNKEITDCQGGFSSASRMTTRTDFEVKSADVIVKSNNFGESVQNDATDNRNLDLLLASKHSGENYCSHESEAKYLMTDDAEVAADCCNTDAKRFNLLVVTHGGVGNDKTVMNTRGFVSDTNEGNREFSDCGGEFPNASKSVENITTDTAKIIDSEVKSEDVIVKHNNFGDDASAHQSVENITTDNQNLDHLQGSKHTGDNYAADEAEAECPMSNDTEFTSDCCNTAVESISLPKEKSCSLDGNLVPGRSQMNSESLKHLGSDSLIHHSSVTDCNSETICDSTPGSAVATHCSSGGGNSCATPEVIILSNQAS